ncbi:hypothetical protein Ciccas_012059 [Cichlidogyrus casuarinus]|uniref:Uncharacterized protein n=1 Tax=Cichlidogyrus casuarinus TaxID=1844966 RepID=A0ABD2PPG4_9PLAT
MTDYSGPSYLAIMSDQYEVRGSTVYQPVHMTSHPPPPRNQQKKDVDSICGRLRSFCKTIMEPIGKSNKRLIVACVCIALFMLALVVFGALLVYNMQQESVSYSDTSLNTNRVLYEPLQPTDALIIGGCQQNSRCEAMASSVKKCFDRVDNYCTPSPVECPKSIAVTKAPALQLMHNIASELERGNEITATWKSKLRSMYQNLKLHYIQVVDRAFENNKQSFNALLNGISLKRHKLGEFRE